jgi:hypothetical protein
MRAEQCPDCGLFHHAPAAVASVAPAGRWCAARHREEEAGARAAREAEAAEDEAEEVRRRRWDGEQAQRERAASQRARIRGLLRRERARDFRGKPPAAGPGAASLRNLLAAVATPPGSGAGKAAAGAVAAAAAAAAAAARQAKRAGGSGGGLRPREAAAAAAAAAANRYSLRDMWERGEEAFADLRVYVCAVRLAIMAMYWQQCIGGNVLATMYCPQ